MAQEKSISKMAMGSMVSLPGWAHSIAALGPETERIIQQHFANEPSTSLFGGTDEEVLRTLGDSLHNGWSDSEAAKIFTACIEALGSHRDLDMSALGRWVLLHPNDSGAVIDCMGVEAPEEISVIRVLSRAGSQKLVFLATWRLSQTQVVLKKLTGPPDLVKQIVDRELQLHPLSRAHPNIIETHFLRNTRGELFLVERCLPAVLSDKWDSRGVQEAANLLYNIANAVTFLHQNKLVHGDIKPDNIGVDGTRYILLDFGICRPADEFKGDATATGSLRTRAPELLETDAYMDPYKVDVWALGATIFNALTGRFPLFDKGEAPPRVSHPPERGDFERELSRRAKEEWEERVDLRPVPEPIRPLLEGSLCRDVRKRLSADDLKKRAEQNLSAFLRVQSNIGRFSPLDELNQLKDYLPTGKILRLMPSTERQDLINRLVALRDNYGFGASEVAEANSLLERIR